MKLHPFGICTLLFTLCISVQLLPARATAQDQYGKLILHKQLAGPWTLLDNKDTNSFFLRDGESSQLRITSTMPELRCYLVNHLKDQLRVRYGVYQTEVAGRVVRTNFATEILSLTSGENLKDWPAKEAADTTALAQHHQKLLDYLKNPAGAAQ